jgi:hypothetical protein
MVDFQATLRAKQKMLKEDLEFFKQQRRLLERYVARSKDSTNKSNCTNGSNNNSKQTDVVDITT